MKPPLDPIDAEFLRDEIEFYLVSRRPCAFTAEGIHRHLVRREILDFPCTAEDVTRELALLEQLAKVEKLYDEHSVIAGYRATAAAVISSGRRHAAG